MELNNKTCPNCSCPMVESSSVESSEEGNLNCMREDGVCEAVNTDKYICTECGYVKEYPKAP